MNLWHIRKEGETFLNQGLDWYVYAELKSAAKKFYEQFGAKALSKL